VRKKATQEDREAEQTDDNADWQHDQGDAKTKTDHHHHESNHDRCGVPEDALDANDPSAVPPGICVRHGCPPPVD